jgi:hypothetical protein
MLSSTAFDQFVLNDAAPKAFLQVPSCPSDELLLIRGLQGNNETNHCWYWHKTFWASATATDRFLYERCIPHNFVLIEGMGLIA